MALDPVALWPIALTGFGAASDVAQTLEAGFRCHLTKPVSAEELLGAIRRVFSKARGA